MTAPLRPQSAEQEFPTVDWAIRAAEKIFSLYRDSNYFRSMPPKPLIAGWAKIILDNAPTQPFILSAAYARAAAPQPESVSTEMRVWVLGKCENGDSLVYGVTADREKALAWETGDVEQYASPFTLEPARRWNVVNSGRAN
jgi:hypothetical protein